MAAKILLLASVFIGMTCVCLTAPPARVQELNQVSYMLHIGVSLPTVYSQQV